MPTRPCGNTIKSTTRIGHRYSHTAIEPHATLAACSADSGWTVFDATQFENGVKHQLGTVCLTVDQVRIDSPFVGGGFDRRIARNVGVSKNAVMQIVRHKDVPSWQRHAHLGLCLNLSILSAISNAAACYQE